MVATLKESIDAFLTSGNYHDLLSIIKGCRNGAVYGAKIRFPHALVMTFLFRDGRQKFKLIWEATYQHSRNLATFVTIYKTLMILQRRIRGKEQSSDSFLAGLIGGFIVFGENNNVNNQIVLYLFSRIMIGSGKALAKRGYLQPWGLTYERALNEPRIFPVFAATIWGIVMWLFRQERDTLQPSLQASMQYLYNDSDKWSGLRNWIWHNK